MLYCDGIKNCNKSVCYIDNKGFIYCELHGLWRKASGARARKLTLKELFSLKNGIPIKY